MNRSVRHVAALLALAAMLLRAAIPTGWMPSATEGTALAMCTAGGVVLLRADVPLELDPGTTGEFDTSAADDSDDRHAPGLMTPCAFGASATLASSALAVPPVSVAYRASRPVVGVESRTTSPRPVSNHPARAPPAFS